MIANEYDWKDEHEKLWNALVPPSGRAETLQGELIRIAGKLTEQAYRNGNMNWDGDHEAMWRFVGRSLDDPRTFSDEQREAIRNAIGEIIRDYDAPDLSYYLISERVVDWCIAHPRAIRLEPGETYRR